MYSAAPGNSITTTPQIYSSQQLKVEGVKGADLYNEFWPGTRYVQVLILANYGDYAGAKTTTFKDLSLIRSSDIHGLKFNFINPDFKRISGISEFMTSSINRTGLSSSGAWVINWEKNVDNTDSNDCFHNLSPSSFHSLYQQNIISP